MAQSTEKPVAKWPLWKRPAVWLGAWFVAMPLWCELWLRLSSSSAKQPFFTVGIPLTVLLTAAIFGLFYGLSLLLPAKWRYGVLTAIAGFCTLVCMVQTVYFKIFDMYFVLFSARGLGDAIGDYDSVMWLNIANRTVYLLAEVAPFVLWCVFGWRRMKPVKPGKRKSGMTVVVSAALYAVFFVILAVLPRGDLTPWHLYWNALEINPSVRNFGALNSLRLDVKYQLFGGAVENVTDGPTDLPEMSKTEKSEPTPTATGTAPTATTPATPAFVAKDQVMNLDFAALAKSESNADLKMLDEYFAGIKPSKTNEYTGMFKGKNVIMVTAESFCSFAVDKELTPTLWKMAHEGLEFTNYYTPIWGVSTLDGEYANLTGTFPKSGVWSMWRARGNNLYFTLGNVAKRAGYTTIAYHNGTYDYYDRHESHFNLGYDKWIAVNSGLEMPHDTWPNSDIELIDVTTGDYMTADKPFSVYYLTISGHAPNTFDGSAMSEKHEDEVANLPYSAEVRGYVAANLELEGAMKLLLERLQAAGKLDDTLIVLAADHYPYGLSEASLAEMYGAGYDKNFEIYHNTLMVYNPQFTHTVISKPCYAVDILPTALNLLGEEYDSRLLMGSDILSDAPGLVVFVNRSWITDYGRYNSVTGVFTPNEGVTVPDGYVDSVNAVVSKKFTVSSLILDKDYYGTLFGPTKNHP